MTIFDILSHPGLRPFEIAVALVCGLLLLEILANQIGVSVFGSTDSDLELDTEAEAGVGALSWLGLGQVPFMIWLAGMLTAFGLAAYLIQMVTVALVGAPLGPILASLTAFGPGLLLGTRTARAIGALFPKTTSSAISRRSYGQRKGVITVGTARAGTPAQARFTDGHGNLHYTMVEPLDRAETLPQGTEILILKSRDGVLKAVRISETT